jgi:polysaccharide export outer membrane protein
MPPVGVLEAVSYPAFRNAVAVQHDVWAVIILAVALYAGMTPLYAEEVEYVLGPADVVHITVFENPELTTETRISEAGILSFPLIGDIRVVGLTLSQASAAIAKKLSDGHFVGNPQVTILPTVVRGSQVTVVGQVNHPGRYPLETVNTKVSDALAAAGGVTTLGADTVFLIQNHGGKIVRKAIDVTELFVKGSEKDEQVFGGDTIFLPRQPLVYVYGEVRTPGTYRLERHMTVMQALAVGGGPTERGSQHRIRVFRQDDSGTVREVSLGLRDVVEPNDVIYVRPRLF